MGKIDGAFFTIFYKSISEIQGSTCKISSPWPCIPKNRMQELFREKLTPFLIYYFLICFLPPFSLQKGLNCFWLKPCLVDHPAQHGQLIKFLNMTVFASLWMFQTPLIFSKITVSCLVLLMIILDESWFGYMYYQQDLCRAFLNWSMNSVSIMSQK